MINPVFLNHNKPPIVVICGPTGIGKTAFALALAESFNAEILGADSMQIYRHMDVGTAKPTEEECSRVTHHLVNIIDPADDFDANRYAELAGIAIEQLHEKGTLPFVVGGTGLYIKSLIFGLFETQPADSDVRKKLKTLAETEGNALLHDRLANVDPVSAEKIHVNDTYRLVRALEVFEITGKPISSLHSTHGFREPKYRSLKIGLSSDRDLMYSRINRRVDDMLEKGLLQEVKQLLSQGYAPELKSMQSLGYKHMTAYLMNQMDWEEAVRQLKRDTRRYAKRQMTWFRTDKEINWLSTSDLERAGMLIRNFLQ